LKDKGLELIAVNYQAGDTMEKITSYISDNKFNFRIVLGGARDNYTLGKAYGVQAYPTNYLLDGEGKIVWRSVGFDEAGLRAALAKMGVK